MSQTNPKKGGNKGIARGRKILMSTAGFHGPTAERLRRARQARELHVLGLSHREVGETLGISRSYASELLADPDGARARARKDSYAQPCVDCGAPTSGSEGRRAEPRCLHCAAGKAALAKTYWTAARIIDRIREWHDLYGDPPAIYDWNPWAARNKLNDEDRARRWEDANGYWPWFTSVVDRFGSFSEGIRAAGFVARAPGGGGDNALRRWPRSEDA